MAKNPQLPRFSKQSLAALGGDTVGEVRLAGETYQVVGLHAVAHQFLRRLSDYLRQQSFHPTQLLALRNDFREISACYCGLGLILSLQSADPIQQRLAAWLLGRRGWRKAILVLRDSADSEAWEVQFEVARALKRLGDWEGLRRMEGLVSSYKQPPSLSPELVGVFSERETHRRRILLGRLKQMTRQRPQRNYQRSLTSFLSHDMRAAEASADAPAPIKLWYQQPLGPGKQPKNLWLIRWFLKRIQAAVRG